MVEEGFPLASKVTHLKIRKPANFIHRSGDWVFLKVNRQTGGEERSIWGKCIGF